MVKTRKSVGRYQEKGPDPDAAPTANQDQAPSNEAKVVGKQRLDKAAPVAELERATTELARLDAVLAGFRSQAGAIVETTAQRLEGPDPSSPGDEVGVLHDLVQSMSEAVQTAQDHVFVLRTELGLLAAHFVGAPSRTVSLAAIMGRLALLDDLALDVIARMVGHLSACARGNVTGR